MSICSLPPLKPQCHDLLGFWRHVDQQYQARPTRIDHAMLNLCWRYHYGMLLQLSTFPTDVESATTFEHRVNFIGAGMRVRLLLLTGLKTVEITEHACGLKQVHFLHLLLVKSRLAEDMFGIHMSSISANASLCVFLTLRKEVE